MTADTNIAQAKMPPITPPAITPTCDFWAFPGAFVADELGRGVEVDSELDTVCTCTLLVRGSLREKMSESVGSGQPPSGAVKVALPDSLGFQSMCERRICKGETYSPPIIP